MTDAPDLELGFPENVVTELETSFREFMSNFEVIRRPLRHTDPAQSLGIFVADWQPDKASQQIGNQREPAINRYEYRIQLLVKAADEVTGRRLFGVGAKSVRAILYRDPALVVRLTALTEEVLGTRETVKQFGVRRQRFLNNEIRGSMMYLATTDVWLDTESLKLT